MWRTDTSLLEQFILLSNPKYTPFQPTGRFDTSAFDNNDQPNPAVAPDSENKDEGSGSGDVQADKIISGLLSVDLDFNKPLTSTQTMIRMTTPLGPSTARRPRSWKPPRMRSATPAMPVKSPSRTKIKTIVETSTTKTALPNDTPQPTKQLGFLSIPGEVRELIYKHLFMNARIYIQQKPSSRRAFDLYLAIRSTCKEIRAETSRALFEHLTVTLNYHDLKTAANKKIGDGIAEHIRDKLQFLTIVATPRASNHVSRVELADMPLRRLKLVEPGTSFSVRPRFDDDLDQSVQRVKSMLEASSDKPWHWLEHLAAQKDRSFSIEYEYEVWGDFMEDRAPHMGNLKKTHYRTVLIKGTEKNSEVVISKTELTTEDFQKRSEMYTWLETRGVHISRRTHVSSALQRLEKMKYHQALDNIEAGLAKVNQASALPKE